MFLENSLAPPTRFDLSFRVGDIPVRVHPYFWLTTLILGWNTQKSGFNILPLLVWVALVFVSVLVHELGHILMGRYFGSHGHIILTGFCGLAVGSADLPERWQRNAVSLAGPGAGFLLAALASGIFWLYNPGITLYMLGSLIGVQVPIDADVHIPSDLVWFIMYYTLWINIFWGLLNLLPIWPLDGGQISREVCQAYRGREGLRLSLMISLFTASGLAILALIEFVAKKPLIPFLSL